jgi:hypothetical protein
MSDRPAKYRLRPLEASEADLQAQVIDFLEAEQARGRVTWFARINGGGARVKGAGGRIRWISFYRLYLPGYVGSKGISDILGNTSTGKLFALEVKRPGEVATAGQQAFIDAVVRAGGIGGVVRSWEEARALFAAVPRKMEASCPGSGERQIGGGIAKLRESIEFPCYRCREFRTVFGQFECAITQPEFPYLCDRYKP